MDAGADTCAYKSYNLPVPLFYDHFLEDMAWGDSIIDWTCNDYDQLNINSKAAKADEGAQPVPEDPNEWVGSMEIFGDGEGH